MFYLFEQNNSGGFFDVDDKLCHYLYIEADCKNEAIAIAESIGCYWDGVREGIDCPCCGDRWSEDCDKIDIEKLKSDGCTVYVGVLDREEEAINKWNKMYGKYTIIEQPEFEKCFFVDYYKYSGKIAFKNIEEYAQCISDTYGWTVPDARIYYKNGEVKEIFTKRKVSIEF